VESEYVSFMGGICGSTLSDIVGVNSQARCN
jgi:hypothetical protein